MNKLLIKGGKVFYNGSEYENAEWHIGGNGVLHISGHKVITKSSPGRIYDRDIISMIENYDITKKTFLLGRRYIPSFTRFKLKKRVYKEVRTSNFTIKEIPE